MSAIPWFTTTQILKSLFPGVFDSVGRKNGKTNMSQKKEVELRVGRSLFLFKFSILNNVFVHRNNKNISKLGGDKAIKVLIDKLVYTLVSQQCTALSNNSLDK